MLLSYNGSMARGWVGGINSARVVLPLLGADDDPRRQQGEPGPGVEQVRRSPQRARLPPGIVVAEAHIRRIDVRQADIPPRRPPVLSPRRAEALSLPCSGGAGALGWDGRGFAYTGYRLSGRLKRCRSTAGTEPLPYECMLNAPPALIGGSGRTPPAPAARNPNSSESKRRHGEIPMGLQKPSEKEEEYFARQTIEKRRLEAEAARDAMASEEKTRLKELHHMHCPKCGQAQFARNFLDRAAGLIDRQVSQGRVDGERQGHRKFLVFNF